MTLSIVYQIKKQKKKTFLKYVVFIKVIDSHYSLRLTILQFFFLITFSYRLLLYFFVHLIYLKKIMILNSLNLKFCSEKECNIYYYYYYWEI